MEKLIAAFVAGLVAALFYPIVCVFFGALSGWLVGLVFESSIRTVLGSLGLNPEATMWQIGATLGFVGGYFKSIQASN